MSSERPPRYADRPYRLVCRGCGHNRTGTLGDLGDTAELRCDGCGRGFARLEFSQDFIRSGSRQTEYGLLPRRLWRKRSRVTILATPTG